MVKARHLKNAPLVEALLEIRVAPAAGIKAQELAVLEERLGGYRKKSEKRSAGIEFSITDAPSAKATSALEGYVFEDKSGKRLVQVSTTAFTQNVLKPYSNFDELVAEARRNWTVYAEHARPVQITRFSLRYINDLRLPAELGMRFEDYLPYCPQVPKDLPQAAADFACRITIMTEVPGPRAVVAQIYRGGALEDGVPVVLDIDAIWERPMAPNDDALWQRFAQLRKLKNEVFFSYVSESLLRRYE